MDSQNQIAERSYRFALQIIEMYKICRSQNEFILSKQVLRSGTSIGANIREASAGFTKKDFLFKMSLASKESRETLYWLELLKDSKLVKFDFETILEEAQNISNILTAIVKTTSMNISSSS